MFDNDHESIVGWNRFLAVEVEESSRVALVVVESPVDMVDMIVDIAVTDIVVADVDIHY